MTTREEVWLRAWCAAAAGMPTDHQTPAGCSVWADHCLKDFDERFPAKAGPQSSETPAQKAILDAVFTELE